MSALKPDVDSTHDLGTTSLRWRNLFVDGITVTDNVTVAGNLTVEGLTTTFETTNLLVEDPLIKLAKGNVEDALDVGFYGRHAASAATTAGNFVTGATYVITSTSDGDGGAATNFTDVGAADSVVGTEFVATGAGAGTGTATAIEHVGMFRDADDDKFHLFRSLIVDPTTTVNKAASGYAAATLVVGHLEPGTAGTGGLGSADAEWSDLFLKTGGSVKFGSGQTVTLTHIDDTGLRLNGTKQLQFGSDGGVNISSSQDGQLDLVADGALVSAVKLNASAGGVDIDAAASYDVSIEGGQVALASKDNAASAISLLTNVGAAETIVVTNTLGQTENSEANLDAAAIQLKAAAGGIGLTWNDSKDLWAEGGRAVITANENAEEAIKLHADAGDAQTIVLQNDAGETENSSGDLSAAAIQLTSTAGGIGLTWNDSKDLWAEGGRAVVTANEDSAAAIKLHADSGTEQTIVLQNDEGTTDGTDGAGSILLAADAGGIGLAWNDSKDLWAEGGRAVITANQNEAAAIKLHADAGASQTIMIVNDEGTSSSAIDLLSSAGGFSVDGVKASNVSVASATDGDDLTISVTGATDSSLVLSSAGTSDVADAEALQVTASAGGMTLKSAKAMSLKTTANNTAIHITPHGTGQVNIGTDSQTPIDLSGAGITLDASSTISIESSGGPIQIGNDANAQSLSIGTGAAARTITVGNTTGATSLALNAGTGGIALASTGTGNISLDSDNIVHMDSDGDFNIDSSAGAINIGVDAVTGGINIGTGDSARTIIVGHTSSTEVELNAATIDINAGGSGFAVSGSGASSMTTSADALSISGKTGLNLQEDGTSVIAIDTNRDVLFSQKGGTSGDPDVQFDGYVKFSAKASGNAEDNAGVEFDGSVQVDGTLTANAAVSVQSTLTVGEDDTGYDVKLFGATAGQYLLWDQDRDELVLAGDTKLSFHDDSSGGGENIVASSDGHLEINAGTTLDMTAPTVDINASTAVTVESATFTLGSVAVAGVYADLNPTLTIQHTGDDANGGTLKFVKDRGAAGAAGDDAGVIQFWADNAAQEQTEFARITAEVQTATDGEEGGKLSLSVAENDGTMTAGLVLTEGDADGIVNVTVGAGSNSTTTIVGDLVVQGDTTTVSSTELTVADPRITLNVGGIANSAGGSGIEIEEKVGAEQVVTGFFKVAADRAGWELQAPANANTLTIDSTASTTMTLAGNLGVESASLINQDLTTDSVTAQLATLTLTTSLLPDAAGGADIGAAAAGDQFGDIYIADQKGIKLGTSAQDVTILHDNDDGLDITAAGSIDLVATADHITASAGANLLLDAGSLLELNSSGGVISIGNDDVDQAISIGADGVRAISIGTLSGAVSTAASTSVTLNAADVTADCSNDLLIKSRKAGVGVKIDSSDAAGGVQILAGTGGFDLDVTDSVGGGSGNGSITMNAAGASTIDVAGANLTLSTSTSGTLAVNSAGVLDLDGASVTLNSSTGTIQIGNDAVAQAISIGTGAAARTITMGNTTGATALFLNAGTGGIALTSTGTGDISLDSDDVMNLDSDGDFNIDSSAGSINIGVDAVDGGINVGTGDSARTITVGHDSSTKVDVNAIDIELDAGDDLLLSSAKAGVGIILNAEDANGGVQIKAGVNGFDVDVTSAGAGSGNGAITMNAAAASTIDVAGANLTLSTTGSGAISLDSAANLDLASETGSTVNLKVGATTELQLSDTTATFGTNILMPNSSQIGSAADPNAITINDQASSTVTITSTTVSTSKTTGALVVSGGLGVNDDVYIGDDLHVGGDLSVVGGSFTSTTTVADAEFKILDDNGSDMTVLSPSGNINVNAGLFTVTGSNGNISTGGTIVVTGQSTLRGNVQVGHASDGSGKLIANAAIVFDDGRIDLANGAATFTPVKPFHILRTGADGNGNTITTIGAGSTGQVIVISKDSTNGGALTLQATSNLSTANALCLAGADITLANDQDTVTLIYNGTNWSLVSHANVSAKA